MPIPQSAGFFGRVSMTGLKTLVTGVSGYVGAALVPRLARDGHAVRGFARSRERVLAAGVVLDDLVLGDATTGRGLDEALDGIDVAYYLIHSMEGPAGAFVDIERRQAEAFAGAAAAAGVKRIVYLGGLLPNGAAPSRHLGSRLAVEHTLLAAAPESVALRASIVIAARSRSFRFLVRLIERLPVLALPAWRVNRTKPVDGRDVLEFLAAAATLPARHAGRAWDIGGPDAMSYEQMLAAHRRGDADRPPCALAAVQPHAGRVGGRGRGGRGGSGADRTADGVARARPAAARRRCGGRVRGASAPLRGRRRTGVA